MNRRHLPLIVLALMAIAFRVVGALFPAEFPNFQPLPALLLCSLVFLNGRARWLLPLGVWVVTDPFVSLLQGYSVIGPHHLSLALGLAAVVALALLVRRTSRTALPMLAGTVAGALAFYFLSNTIAFLSDPLYAKTWEGFVQAQWTGPLGFVPTWIFLRNLLVANLLFTALVLIGHRLPLGDPAHARAAADAKHTA